MSRRRHLFPTATLLLLFIIASLLWHKGLEDAHCAHSCPSETPVTLPTTLLHQNIAVASVFGWHFNVYLPLVWSMQRVLKGQGNVQVYADTPFAYNFQNLSDELGLYHGSFKTPPELISDLRRNPAIDMVVLGTCEADVGHWQDELLAAWDARDQDNKFCIVCIVHNQLDANWQQHITPWAMRNAIRILPISEHVAKAFRKHFNYLSNSLDPKLRTASYDLIPIDVHVQVLDIPRLTDKSVKPILSNAVIQGSFSEDRRAYRSIFEELIQRLHQHPASWGYLPLDKGPSYVPDTDISDPPFKLHLVGSGWLDIPLELQNIVVLHTGLSYNEYYEVMAGMDVCVPAFGQTDDYYTVQASSTVATCMEANIPILATRRLREAYTYADDDRVMINYPAVMTEIDVIRALRMRDASHFLASDPSGTGRNIGSNAAVRTAVEQMIAKDWVRSKQGFDDVKKKLWARNDYVVMKLLGDLP